MVEHLLCTQGVKSSSLSSSKNSGITNVIPLFFVVMMRRELLQRKLQSEFEREAAEAGAFDK